MLKLGLFLPAMEGWLGDGWLPRWRELSRLAGLAESIGFDALFVPDHLIIGHSPYWGIPEGESRGTWEAWTLLAALAAETRRAAIGAFVIGAGFRNPALLAKMAATVDEVSGGRLILGLGCGSHPPEYAAFGYPYDHRVDRFEEVLQILVPLLREGRVDFVGRYHAARACELRPRAAARRAADLDRRVPAPDDAPRRPLGRRVRHRLASGRGGPLGALRPSRGRVRDGRAGSGDPRPRRGRDRPGRRGTAPSPPDGHARRHAGGDRGRAPRVSRRGVGHVVCMLDPRDATGIERFAPVIELVHRAER